MSKQSVRAQVTGSIWKIMVEPGQKVGPGTPLMILESMKMEIPLEAEDPGVVVSIRVKEGQAVNSGEIVLELEV